MEITIPINQIYKQKPSEVLKLLTGKGLDPAKPYFYSMSLRTVKIEQPCDK
jgi:hypothetical protein